MNDELVFSRTPAGEDALRERTRLVQRNLRMVLSSVDGVVDVAALKSEIRDAALVESALADLVRMGLIETSNNSAASGAVPGVDEPDPIPVLSEVATVGASSAGLGLAPGIRADSDEGPGGRVNNSAPSLVESTTAWWQARQHKRAEAQEEAMFEKAYVEARVETDNTADKAVPEAKPAPVRRVKRKINPGRWLALATVVGLALGIGWLLFYPYDEYRPKFEQQLSRMLDDTVKVGHIQVGFTPLPTISLERVTVGDNAYAEIAAVNMIPEPWTLLGDNPQYRQVVIDGMRFQDAGVARLTHWFTPANMDGVEIGKLEISGLSVALGAALLTEFKGEAHIDQRGLTKIDLRAKEGDFQVELVPVVGGLSISLRAMEYKLPFQLPLTFAAFDMAGTLSPGHLAIDRLGGLGYDGQFNATGAIDWQQEAASMALTVNYQNIAVRQLLPALGAPALLEGVAAGRLALSANAPDVNRFGDVLRIDGNFQLARGDLKRLDLAGALRQVEQATTRGGNTAFESFSGTVSSDARSIRLGGLRLSSGLLQAVGYANIARQATATVTGSANVELRGSTGTLRAPVAISGRIADPELKTSR